MTLRYPRLFTLLSIIAVAWFATTSAQANTPSENPDTLRVLVCNLWHGGNEINNGPEKALQLIKDSGADICLLQESHDIKGPRPKFGLWAAEELGWNAWMGDSTHLCVLSPYKFKQTFIRSKQHCVGAELEDHKGRTIHAFTVWIESKHYTPYHLRDHPQSTDAELLACETTHSRRLKQATGILRYLEQNKLDSLQTPLLVGGDWNNPSHLDWTQGVEEVFPPRRPLPFPVSMQMEKNGFIDIYRNLYPDPFTHPGNTWTPLRSSVPQDRIDRLYYKSNQAVPQLRPVRTTLYPEVLEDESIPTPERQFSSDHAALLIEFEWIE